MRALKSESELDNVLGASCAVLLKHGATCPISAKARDEIADLCRRRPDLTVASVEVKDHRALSDTIAERLGVEHQSPQVFVLRNGAVAWSAEHYEIKADDVERQLAG